MKRASPALGARQWLNRFATFSARRALWLRVPLSSRGTSGVFEGTLGPGSTVEVDVEEARRGIASFFGTDDASEALRRLRVRL